MAKISTIFGLARSQSELDFIDIDISKDNLLFVDPYRISQSSSSFSIEANKRINSFFTYLIELLIDKNYTEAKRIFSYLGEVNETCLGMSKDKPSGKGIGPKNTENIFNELIKSDVVKLRQLKKIEDLRLFVKGVDRDKISDMTTNIIRDILIEYTQNQCELYGLPLKEDIQSGFYWDYKTKKLEKLFNKNVSNR